MIVKIIKNKKNINLQLINNLLFQLDPKCYPLNIDSLKKILSQENIILIGGYKNNKKNSSLIGIIVLVFYRTLSGYRCRIEDLVVDEKERGKGVGTRLLKKAMAIGKTKQVDFIELTSRPERKVANLLYQKMGFKIKKTNVYRYYFH